MVAFFMGIDLLYKAHGLRPFREDALAYNCWAEPAYPGTSIPFLIGDLGLTPEEQAAIVAYMKIFTDQYIPNPPKPYKPSKD